MLKHFACAAGVVLLLVPGLFAQDNKWVISGYDSFANFSVRHLMISKARGKIGGIKGSVVYDPKDPSKDSVDVTLDVKTFNTGEPKRDEQVTTDYFEVAKYPTITFKSTKVAAASDGGLTVTGNLTIHGVSREVVFAVEGPTAPGKDPWGNTRVGLSAVTKINRKDFGLTWNSALETGGILVGDEVTITLDVQFVKA